MARGGSKRLPGKNVKLLGGKPMIAWTIEAAKRSKYVDRVIVSTDSEEIARFAKKYGAEVPFERPAELATDTASAVDVATHALSWLKEQEGTEYDYLAQLQATSPLRTATHIDEAIEKLIDDQNLDALGSFYTWDKKPDWIHTENDEGFLEASVTTKPTAKNAKAFLVPNGAIALVKTSTLLKDKTFYPKKLGAYIMDAAQSVDIDTQQDFDMALLLINGRARRKKSVFIGDHEINERKRVFIIAEAGVNHNGQLDLALKLVDMAAQIGADAVKFQTFRAEQVVTETGEMTAYQKKNMGVVKSQIEMLRELELPEDMYPALMKRCEEKGIIFLSTPHGGVASVDFLETLGMMAYKIGSGDLTNYLLLERIARTGKPIILSTGMATLEEVQDAVAFIRSKGNDKIIVLHCTSQYPCPPDEVNMAALQTLMQTCDAPVGFSDHTDSVEAACMATSLGQALYEFHFTIDKNLPGPDHVASASPKEARERITAIRTVELMMGSGTKQPTANELKTVLPIARKGLVAAHDLKKGQVLTQDDLEAKRPNRGISPISFEQLLNKKLKRALKKDEAFEWDDIEV